MDNPFKGVNPHLNSELQTPGTNNDPALWASFHAHHVTNIAEVLNQQLPENYVAYTEQSLQVRGVDWGDEVVSHRPRPDVSVYQTVSRTQSPFAEAVIAPDWEATLAEALEPIEYYAAVVIRQPGTQNRLGKIVARLELLSPANKPDGSHAAAYRDRRVESLASGVPLIEIDYLHESATVIPKLPVYPHESGSYPYTVAVSDPRPDWQTGQVKVYGAVVNQPLPRVPIPLAGAEGIVFDFDPVYQHTFKARRSHTLIKSYDTPPVRFETYSQADQKRILQHITELRTGHD